MKSARQIFSEKLQYYIKKKGIDYNQFARDIKVSQPTVSSWVNMKKYPRIETIERISEYFNVDKSDLTSDKPKRKMSDVPYKTIPVLSKISAGMPVYAEENVDEFTTIAGKFVKPNKEYFGLIVSGDSMNLHFREGDIVIVEKDSIIENGQIAVVQVNGYNATLKKVKYEGDSILLIPESSNPDHDVQLYSKDDEVHLIGRVVGMTRTF